MPVYKFQNTETNEEFELEMKIAELEEYTKCNPHLVQLLTSMNYVSHTGGLRPPGGFQDVLEHIKDNNYGNAITTGNLSQV